jgi:hypothetical protein
MGMQVDEARRDDKPVGIDYLFCEAWRTSANLRDFAIFNPDVRPVARKRVPSTTVPPFIWRSYSAMDGSLLTW